MQTRVRLGLLCACLVYGVRSLGMRGRASCARQACYQLNPSSMSSALPYGGFLDPSPGHLNLKASFLTPPNTRIRGKPPPCGFPCFLPLLADLPTALLGRKPAGMASRATPRPRLCRRSPTPARSCHWSQGGGWMGGIDRWMDGWIDRWANKQKKKNQKQQKETFAVVFEKGSFVTQIGMGFTL